MIDLLEKLVIWALIVYSQLAGLCSHLVSISLFLLNFKEAPF